MLGGLRSGSLCEESGGVIIEREGEDEEEEEDEDRLFFREPPPTGTFLRVPPSVQYLLQVLQKYLG